MDVYIFGAGASAAEGAPVTRHLFPRAWQLLGPQFDPQMTEVWRFLEAVFQRPVEGEAAFRLLPPVDEVISLVDWSLQNDQGLGAAYDPPGLYRVRRALEHLICATLEAAVRRGSDAEVGSGQGAEGEGGPHGRFARALLRQTTPFTLISLNYDTLLDEALAAAGAPPDYGLAPEPHGGPLLLKLHGSLNWAHCPACDQIVVAGEQVAHRLPGYAALSCDRCANPNLRGVIISPTLLKRYTVSALGRVFDHALEALRAAHRIRFIGYSLPSADVAVHQLLRRGLLTRGTAHPPAIEVVTRRPSSAVVQRFQSLFGPDVRFDFSGFRGQI